MPINITMPALSPTMEEGNLAKWLVKEGDAVAAGDIIAEIETDKATMEVEAVDEGTVGRLAVAEGSEGVPVNTVIAVLLEEGESADDIGDIAPPAPAAGPAQAVTAKLDVAPGPQNNGEVLANPSALRLAEEEGVDITSVPGTGPHGRITKGDVIIALENGLPTQALRPERAEGQRIFASPLARKLAADKGYDLGDMTGSGPNGRIVKADVEAFVPTSKAPGPAIVAVEGDTPFEEVRLSAMRKTIAKRMTESKQTIPHFYLTADIEIDALLAARADINETLLARGLEVKVSVNDLVIRAAALALMQEPDANVQFAGDTMKRFSRADIAVAVALDGGLITPIVRGADLKDLPSIATEMKELAGRARAGKLMPEEYQGGTLAISNLGMFGIREFAAVINPPHSAILAIGQGEKRAVVRNDQLTIATIMTVNMACDHRAMDGAIGAQYLTELKGLLEHPVRMLV